MKKLLQFMVDRAKIVIADYFRPLRYWCFWVIIITLAIIMTWLDVKGVFK